MPNLPKQYKFMRVREETLKSFQEKNKKMNEMLKKMGTHHKKITTIDMLNMVSKQPIFLNDKELKELAKRKVRKF